MAVHASPYQQGCAARKSGKSESNNPYGAGTYDFSAWLRGFRDTDFDMDVAATPTDPVDALIDQANPSSEHDRAERKKRMHQYIGIGLMDGVDSLNPCGDRDDTESED